MIGIGAIPVLTPVSLVAQTRQSAAQVEQATRTVLDRQRAYDSARMRREPVTQLLADGFVEIQADGRVLTRSQAIEKYTRFDDVSTGSFTERRTASYGDVVIIAGRAGEEGTPYSAQRLYVWVSEGGSWRLLVFQKTFVRSRTARFSPVSAEWPAEYRNEQPPLSEEGAFATRDSALLTRLLADDTMLVDGFGEQFTGRTWLARLNETKESAVNVRGFRLLHQGDAIVVIGDEVAAPTGLASRFTHVWRRSSQGTGFWSASRRLQRPRYSVRDDSASAISRYLQIPENTLRSWVSGRSTFALATKEQTENSRSPSPLRRCGATAFALTHSSTGFIKSMA